MKQSAVVVLTPPGIPDPSLAISACRAGARGIIDLEFCPDEIAARSAIRNLVEFTRAPFGIKVAGNWAELAEQLVIEFGPQLSWVLIAGGEAENLANACWNLQGERAKVLWEATNSLEMKAGAEAGVDGLVLKGNEAGGRVGEETAFVLLQRFHQVFNGCQDHPGAWVQGGIGLHTAAACFIGGADGIVLDSQLLLSRESRLNESERRQIAALDGGETITLGVSLGAPYRMLSRPRCAAVENLTGAECRLEAEDHPGRLRHWREALTEQIQTAENRKLLLVGQDVALAAGLAERFVTAGGIIQGIVEQARRNAKSAKNLQLLAEGAPLAASHKTRYPLLQGPMTRVSDTAPFADAVSAAGALPFLALALLRKNEVLKLLEETSARLEGRSWGVGILGFLPPEIRAEQVEAIRQYKPPFALIAGGRPDQASELEKDGIPTYLHVPSPGLLKMFLRDGARRFVFEGRECGGHVGPRSSFVLWETMCELLLAHLGPGGRGDDLHVVFAGGIHDRASAAMAAAIAAPLAERGVKIGLLMGTAYLFTEEAISAGAIVPRFQKEALSTAETVLLTTGPGHAIRCIKTPYFDVFDAEKRRLQAAGKSHEEIVKALEWMNIGRLRVASKGLDRIKENGVSELREVNDEQQHERGMYMIGQVAALHDRVVTMSELHDEVCAGGMEWIEEHVSADIEPKHREDRPAPCDVAIIGMSSFYPRAIGLQQYWENILQKVDAVTEVPATHWDWRPYYDPDPRAKDRIVSKWGGFLGDVVFDPLRYGITPKSMLSIEPLQLLLLEGVRQGLDDAGYSQRPFDRERTCAILGIGGGGSPLAVAYGFRACLPMLDTVEDIPARSGDLLKYVDDRLPEWTEDSFPGFLMNVAVGRVANRFNFGGSNYAIDAACASSLAAVHSCLRELEMGTADVAVAMGADTVQTPYAYMAFSKTHALSRRGKCSPFDADADGIVLSEGIGVCVLKRLADAERDGDPIYAVIKGVGSSSDGKDKGLTAPNVAGQMRAVGRAYAKAGISPSRLGLIEAHGTGTVVGDQTETSCLQQVLREAGAETQSCALGSVKSMIGHSKCAAGIAGLIKTAMALHTKTLPPTRVEKPNPKAKFQESAVYLNTESRPWVHGQEHPRTAGVSAFGFGGTNVHIVLEEYTGEFVNDPPPAMENWPAELLIWRAASRAELLQGAQSCRRALAEGAQPPLKDLAASLWKACPKNAALPTAAIVADSLKDAEKKLALLEEILEGEKTEAADPRGVFFCQSPDEARGRVAFLFPGQGSQYPNMLAQTAMAFPTVRRSMDKAERLLADKLDRPLGRYVYPRSTFTPEEESRVVEELSRTDVAQPAIGAASLGLLSLLGRFGIKADYCAGHSYGEYVALCAAGVLSEDDLLRISHRRGEVILEASGENRGTMAAIDSDEATVQKIADATEGLTVANVNSPRQVVVSGSEKAIDKALSECEKLGLRGRRIPVSCAFHSPLVAGAAEKLAEFLADIEPSPPQLAVYSNTTADKYPTEPQEIRRLLADHLKQPVRFRDEVETIYAAGARVFVEVGPHTVLTNLVKQTLGERPHTALATDVKGRPGLVQLLNLLGGLLAAGQRPDLHPLFAGRRVSTFDPARLDSKTGVTEFPKSVWVVNGIRTRPIHGEEPKLLGQSRGEMKEKSSQPAGPAAAVAPRLVSASGNGSHAASAVSPQHSAPPAHSQNGAPPAIPPQRLPATQQPAVAESNGAVHGDDTTAVMMRYQDLMSRFLETQQQVMLSFLQGGVVSAGNGIPALAHAPAAPSPATTPSPAAYSGNGNGHYSHAGPFEAAPAVPESPPAASEPAAAAAEANGATHASPELAADFAFDREKVATQLLDLVSERTGYPHEMLDMDLDLEGDLGVDSIKRVEILGNLAELIGLSADEGQMESKIEFEKLTSIKSLRGILDYLEEALTAEPGAASVPPPSGSAGANGHPQKNGAQPARGGQVEVQRGLVELVETPLPRGGAPVIPSGTLLITDDERGIAQELAGRLADYGQQMIFLRIAAEGAEHRDGVIYADLTDEGAVQEALRLACSEGGPIGGLIHLLPLAAPPQGESDSLRMAREVKSLYLLARGLEEELRRGNGSILLAPTALGGGFGFGTEPLPEDYFAGHGGILGFTKCLGMEWPEVLVRAIDLDGAEEISLLVDQILGELSDRNGPLEIGHHRGQRISWQPAAGGFSDDDVPAPPIQAGDTLLITGGARGITATIARELARRYQANLVLVGRSPLPEEDEPAETASLTDAGAIKAALIERMRREGRPPAPAAIEAAFQRILREREIRGNLAAIEEAGGKVTYRACDVRDMEEFGRLLKDIVTTHGRIDGVIHGAGVIEDKLVKDKTPASFDRVLKTKTESAMLLRKCLDPQSLKFCVFFSSIASRYGNRGQADYAAANEILAKLAWQLDREWPCRVVSIDWGPWSGVGMVSDLEKHLVARGLKLISPEVGPQFVIDELERGRKGQSEVMIAGGAEHVVEPKRSGQPTEQAVDA